MNPKASETKLKLKSPSMKLLMNLFADIESQMRIAYAQWGNLVNDDQIIRTKGRGTIEFYDQMVDSDATVAGLIETRIGAVAGLEWEVQTASDESVDQELAEFVREAIDNIKGFDEALEVILRAMVCGYSVTEVIWEQKSIDGRERLIPRLLVPINPSYFRFDSDLNLKYLSRGHIADGEAVPNYKFIVHRFGMRYIDRPYGVSILRAIYWYWWFKHHGIKHWLTATERGATVTPVGYYPEHFNKDEITEFADALKKFLGNKYIAAREGSKIDFPHIKIDPQFAEKLKDAMNQEMRYRVLGSTLSSGTDQTGSRALGEVHDKRFQERIESDAKRLMSTINNALIRWIVDLNFIEAEAYPTWIMDYEAAKDLKLVGENLERAAKLGIPITKKYAAEQLRLQLAPDDVEEEDLISISQGAGGGDGGFGNPTTEATDDEIEDADIDDTEPEAKVKARVSRRTFKRRARKRQKKYNAHMESLEAAAIKGSDPVWDNLVDQSVRWLRRQGSLENAFKRRRSLRLDSGMLKDYLESVMFSDLLWGMNDLYDTAGVTAKASVGWARQLAIRLNIIRAQDDPVEDIGWTPLAPDRAISLWEDRLPLNRQQFDTLSAGARRRAVTASGYTVETIESGIKRGISEALAAGETLDQYIDTLVKRDMFYTSRVHQENVFRTNVLSAYNTGHAEALHDPRMAKAIPAFQFLAIVDDRTTEICLGRDQQIFPRDQLTQQDIAPPCHFRCRSTIIPVFSDEWDGTVSKGKFLPAQKGFGRYEPIIKRWAA